MSKFEGAPHRVKKPSLLPSSPPVASASGKIFAGLEQGGKTKPIFKKTASYPLGWSGSKWVLGLLGMMGVAGAIVAYQSATPPAAAVDATHQQVSAKRVTTPPPMLAAVTPEPQPQGLAALIVNDPAVESRPTANLHVVAVSPQAPAVMPDISDDAHKPLLRTAPETVRQNTPAIPKPKVVAAREPAGLAPPASAARRAESSVNSRLASNTVQQSTKPRAVPGAVSAKPHTENADKDVALLAALVAHSAEQPAQRSAQPSARVTENTSKSAKNPPQSASAATAVKTRERNRDIVERSPTESTGALLQRCKQLGFFEGEFCRWRICSGRWDSDTACQMPQSTSF